MAFKTISLSVCVCRVRYTHTQTHTNVYLLYPYSIRSYLQLIRGPSEMWHIASEFQSPLGINLVSQNLTFQVIPIIVIKTNKEQTHTPEILIQQCTHYCSCLFNSIGGQIRRKNIARFPWTQALTVVTGASPTHPTRALPLPMFPQLHFSFPPH